MSITVTKVFISPDKITLSQNDEPEGQISTSITRTKISMLIKGMGLAALISLIVGGLKIPGNLQQNWKLFFQKDLEKNKQVKNFRKYLGFLFLLLTFITTFGVMYYENGIFRTVFRYNTDFNKSSSSIVSSPFLSKTFKIKKENQIYNCTYISEQNFSISDKNGVVFETQNNDNYKFESTKPVMIGSGKFALLSNVVLTISIINSDIPIDIIVLAATLTYLHNKLRPVNIIAGAKLMGVMVITLPVLKNFWDNISNVDVPITIKDSLKHWLFTKFSTSGGDTTATGTIGTSTPTTATSTIRVDVKTPASQNSDQTF
jgi:hypothetical protein